MKKMSNEKMQKINGGAIKFIPICVPDAPTTSGKKNTGSMGPLVPVNTFTAGGTSLLEVGIIVGGNMDDTKEIEKIMLAGF